MSYSVFLTRLFFNTFTSRVCCADTIKIQHASRILPSDLDNIHACVFFFSMTFIMTDIVKKYNFLDTPNAACVE